MKNKIALLAAGLAFAALSASQALAQASNGAGPARVSDESSSLLLVGAALTGVILAARRMFRK